MNRGEAAEIMRYCKKEGLPTPTMHRTPGTDAYWLLWFENYNTRYVTYRGARHYVRSLEYEKAHLERGKDE